MKEREEITKNILSKTIEDMHAHNRYHEMLVIIDTCQAGSLIPSVTQFENCVVETPSTICLFSEQQNWRRELFLWY